MRGILSRQDILNLKIRRIKQDMKVILKEDVEGLGLIGKMVNVSDGYARNYLIPRNLAVPANPKNMKSFEHEKKQIMARAEKVKKSIEEIANRLANITLEIKAKAGDEGKLFGSITTMDIADAISRHGIEIDRRKIMINEAIKRIGTYDISVRLHPEVTARLSLNVKRED